MDLIFSNLNNLNLKLITKSHPRSPKNKVNILSNLILERTDSIKKYSEIFLHVTFNSSSVFEYGLCGIPTILLGGLSRRDPTFFVNEYNFPFPNLIINNSRDLEYAISFLKNEKNYLETSKAIKDWSIDIIYKQTCFNFLLINNLVIYNQPLILRLNMAVDNKFPGKDVTPEDLKTKIPLVHNYKPKISTICGVKFGGKKFQ